MGVDGGLDWAYGVVYNCGLPYQRGYQRSLTSDANGNQDMECGSFDPCLAQEANTGRTQIS